MDTPYSNRELEHKFNDVHEKLDKILEQTTRHNGRMSKMEKWQSYIQGALAVAGVIVVPILGWVLYQVVSFGNLNDRIDSGIQSALSEYDIRIE